ncbi:MAG: flagellar export chaperone FliS [Defluviitoga tunisiensis]|jgi:flagellar protein FliS|uniref:Flagellar secretion chaperone FliS n=1 Tax=Defluviitoga tunisiensis TaxID=1006576 RepID=A0A0C7P3H4_DEFTU|nr:flagellar export chaperone FliS [Defluviitoga tunisiensis]MDD3601656.1 flagellar export chaperone FliS [Defluviitoga tunisiensis]MDY0379954.1 flagellar export chaperone FliS [Defluviitoga tunisiensis]CEP78845.1 flagellar protein FliS [Defluviitoga tunisiensis]HHV02209.1 flagellar export chaperone FliS [Defluviitoga tunisiensis]HOK16775.1 flagellar export chaperone FliS [Defluviitoga tunisiensis]
MNNFQNSNVYFENSVKTASPTKLVELLYKNSIERLEKAVKAIEKNNLIEANHEIIRVEEIILELNVSLNIEKGGEVAKNLRLLYNYIYEQLIQANLKKDIDTLTEVKSLIKDLYETWREVVKQDVQTARQLNATSLDPKFDIKY